MDIAKTIEPKSNQQNFDDYLTGPKTVTVAEVRKGTSEQPVEVHLVEFPGKPYKPSKSMRRVLVEAWGIQTAEWAGRKITLYGEPSIRFGGETVGGIRISHLSHIDAPIDTRLTVSRGKRERFHVQPLTEAAQTATSPTQAALDAFKSIGVTVDQLTTKLGGRTPDAWTDADLEGLRGVFTDIQNRASSIEAEFGGGEN